MRLTTTNRETLYRVAFKLTAGGLVHTAFKSRPLALAGIARRFASGRYALATMSKVSRPKDRWGNERVEKIESFDPTTAAAAA